MNARQFRVAASLAALGVALGAFGAHKLKPALEASKHLDTWQTAVFYHLLHAVAVAALAGARALPSGAGWCLLAGVGLFSGSLYFLALGIAPAVLGPITPLGGLLFIAGWIWVAASFSKVGMQK